MTSKFRRQKKPNDALPSLNAAIDAVDLAVRVGPTAWNAIPPRTQMSAGRWRRASVHCPVSTPGVSQ